MKKTQMKQKCPRCGQTSGVDIIYGSFDTLSDSHRSALMDGDVVLGGENRMWDWEEELIDTRCLRCQHEWHAWPERATETSE